MLGAHKTKPLAIVMLTVIMLLSSLTVIGVEPINAQSTDNGTETLTEVTNAHLTITHISGNKLVIQLEKGDHLEGKYTIGNIYYYPNWPTIDLKAGVTIEDPNSTNIYHTYTKSGGSFNLTASQSGNYTFVAVSNLVGELLYGNYYLTTSEINQATPLEVALNYTITRAPLEITLSSPTSQAYLQGNVSLNFSSSRVCDWAGYSLDGADLVPLLMSNSSAAKSYANTTLPELSIGTHTLTLYANDSYGNLSSKNVTFSVVSSEDLGIGFLSMLPWVAIVVLVIVLIGAFCFKLYRKPQPHEEKTCYRG